MPWLALALSTAALHTTNPIYGPKRKDYLGVPVQLGHLQRYSLCQDYGCELVSQKFIPKIETTFVTLRLTRLNATAKLSLTESTVMAIEFWFKGRYRQHSSEARALRSLTDNAASQFFDSSSYGHCFANLKPERLTRLLSANLLDDDHYRVICRQKEGEYGTLVYFDI